MTPSTTAIRATAPFDVQVNDRPIPFDDPVVTGRQILSAAGFDPASDHILIQRLRRGTRSVSLDEEVQLRTAGVERFYGFKADRTFSFTIDERAYEWGAATMAETLLRDFAEVKETDVLLLERDGADQVIERGGSLTLKHEGVEHLRSVKELITVTIDGDENERHIPRGKYTTERLIDVLGIGAGYVLEVVAADGDLKMLAPGETLRVKDGMHFFSHVPTGASS